MKNMLFVLVICCLVHSGGSRRRDSDITVLSVTVNPSSGIVGIGDSVVATVKASVEGLSVADDACMINGKQVKFKDEGSGKYTLKIVVEENDNDRSPGTVPISCAIQQSDTSKTVSRIFKFTEENDLAIDAHRPNLGKASIVRILPKSPVGIGGRLILKIVGSTTDEGLRLGDCRANIPMPWDESDTKRRAAVIFMSQVLSKNAVTSKVASKVQDEVTPEEVVVTSSGSTEEKKPFDDRQNMIHDLPVQVFLEKKDPSTTTVKEKTHNSDDQDSSSSKKDTNSNENKQHKEEAEMSTNDLPLLEDLGGRQVINFMEIGRGLYTVEYEVKDGDADQQQGELPFLCTLMDAANNAATIGPTRLYKPDLIIDAHAPKIKETKLVSPLKTTRARMGTNITVALVATEIGLKAETCLLDNYDATSSHSRDRDAALDPSGLSYFFSFSVEAGQGDWPAGKMPIDCSLSDAAGNVRHTKAFTDGNMLAGQTNSPGFMDYVPNLALVVRFVVVAICARSVGDVFPSFGLPRITGYLLMGMVAGPHGLELIPESDIRTLRFVDELSLAFIAFTAGGKLLLGQLQRRIHAVMSVTVGLVVFEYVIGSGTVVLLAPHIEFMSEMDHLQCLAVGLMAGALVIARSPASAIAIVRELRCEKGRFTQLVLGVTVIMDLVVICLFALTSLVSDALLSQTQRVGTVLGLFVVQLGLSTLLGLGLGASLPWILYRSGASSVQSLNRFCETFCGYLPESFRYKFHLNVESDDEGEENDEEDNDDNDDTAPLLKKRSVKKKTKIDDEDDDKNNETTKSRWEHHTKTPGQYSKLRWLRDNSDDENDDTVSRKGDEENGHRRRSDSDNKRRRRKCRRDRRYRSWGHFALVFIMDTTLLLAGFATFALAHCVEPLLEPLIICMVAGFICVNFTRHGDTLEDAEDRVAPVVHVAFFTLTGAALDLASVGPNILFAVLIALGRVFGIFLGAYFGGRLAGEPEYENRRSWMAYITQAGVALGLAKKVHLEHRVWGGSFATMMVSVVVINQIVGPPFFRSVINAIERRSSSRQDSSSSDSNSNSITENERDSKIVVQQ